MAPGDGVDYFLRQRRKTSGEKEFPVPPIRREPHLPTFLESRRHCTPQSTLLFATTRGILSGCPRIPDFSREAVGSCETQTARWLRGILQIGDHILEEMKAMVWSGRAAERGRRRAGPGRDLHRINEGGRMGTATRLKPARSSVIRAVRYVKRAGALSVTASRLSGSSAAQDLNLNPG